MKPTEIAVAGFVVALLGMGAVFGVPARAGDDTEMIVDGTPAPDGKYPYQVRLYSSLDDDKGSCGGSLIAPLWVLTAAHCMYAPVRDPDTNKWSTEIKRLIGTDEVVIGYGSNDRKETVKVESEALYPHPDYLACNGNIQCSDDAKADIALIKLKTPVTDPKAVPVPLATPDNEKTLLVPGAKVIVTGWGAMWNPYDNDVVQLLSQFGPGAEMEEKMNFPRKLHEVEVDWMDNASCSEAFGAAGAENAIADREICAMRQGTRKDSCQGDSGGPLVVPASGGGFVQVGVVSWGFGCGGSTPGVYARVAAFNDWLNTTMTNPPAYAAPVAGGAPARGSD